MTSPPGKPPEPKPESINPWGETSEETLSAAEEEGIASIELEPNTDEVEIIPDLELEPPARDTTIIDRATLEASPEPAASNPWGEISDEMLDEAQSPVSPASSSRDNMLDTPDDSELIDDWDLVDDPSPSPGGFSSISSPDQYGEDQVGGDGLVPQEADNRVFSGRYQEPFSLPSSAKVGIIGGKGTGKSYLFQAMVYRTYSGRNSGALSLYLGKDSVRVFRALRASDLAQSVDTREFLQQYERWIRLDQTLRETQCWYKLRMRYRNGFLGMRRSSMDVDFYDASGEGLAMKVFSDDQREVWRGYSDARVMVFCLPLWAAFPDGSRMKDDDWRARDEVLAEFSQVVTNYNDCRRENRVKTPAQTLLALTMADDERGALESMRARWIDPFLREPDRLLKKLRRGSGVARYLDNARKISSLVLSELEDSGFPEIQRIPGMLDFGGGEPWVVPTSAVDGAGLQSVEHKYPDPNNRPPRLRAPVPVHVELPLLVALCERHNALM